MYEATSKALGPWMRAIRRTAGHALIGMDWKINGPMSVQLRFFLPRPQHHFGRRAGTAYLRADAPTHHAVKADIDKLARASLDAMTGLLFSDDMQVYSLTATKEYAYDGEVGCQIIVERVGVPA